MDDYSFSSIEEQEAHFELTGNRNDGYYDNVDCLHNIPTMELQVRDLPPVKTNLAFNGDGGIQFITNGITRMAINSNGDFIVNNKIVENDMEVYEGFKAWLESTLQTTLER